MCELVQDQPQVALCRASLGGNQGDLTTTQATAWQNRLPAARQLWQRRT
jgi:hypothetical protein